MTFGTSGKDNLCERDKKDRVEGQINLKLRYVCGSLSLGELPNGKAATFALIIGPYRGTDRLSWGPGVFGKTWGRSAVTFVLANFPYDGGRSEYGLAQPRAAGFFTVASGTFALENFPL